MPFDNWEIADTLIDTPIGVNVNGRRFLFYPPSLGLTLYIGKQLNALGIDPEISRISPTLAAICKAEQEPREVARIVALATTRTKEEAYDEALIAGRAKPFARLPSEELAALLLSVTQPADIGGIMKRSGIEREAELTRRAASAAEQSGGTLTFGAVTLYGKLIDRAAERYGWTLDYILWGISFQSLQLLIADSPQSIYLTEKERQKAAIPRNRETIKANDRETLAKMFGR